MIGEHDWRLLRIVVSAVASALVLLAVVVVEYDLTYLRRKMTGKAKHRWRWTATALIAAVGFAEAYNLARLLTGVGPVPDWPAAGSDAAWGLLALFLLAGRPLARYELVRRGDDACGGCTAHFTPAEAADMASAATVLDAPVPVVLREGGSR